MMWDILNEVKRFVKLLPLMIAASIGNDISITALLNPHSINAGGATGLSTVLSQWTGIPFAIVYGLVNLPILILGLRYLNFRYSFYSVFVTAVTTVLFPYLQHFTVDFPPVIAALIGAVIYGISIGITYRFDFSLGGFALLAKVLEVVTKKNVGSLFMLINFVPVLLAASNSSLLTLLWSVVFIVATGEVINWTTMGRTYVTYCQMRFGSTVRMTARVRNEARELDKAS